MNLTDQETLELAALCDAVVDRRISTAETDRLEAILATSPEARRFYVRSMALSASLHSYAGEMQSDEPDRPPFPSGPARFLTWTRVVPLAVAASLVFGFWFAYGPHQEIPYHPIGDEFVARLTGSKDCRWNAEPGPKRLGDHVRRGQRLELESGLAEVTFDSGARIVLEGPGAIEMDSAWELTLHHGTLQASVPPQALGFRVTNARVEVVDLGTEFTMIADRGGATEVLVLRGAVEAEPHPGFSQESIVLYEKEGRRFTHSGISAIRDGERKFARYSRPPSLDRFAPTPGYLHWHFDETQGGRFEAAPHGGTDLDCAAVMRNIAPESLSRVHVEGHRQGGLNFTGSAFASASVPGLSANGPRTVAFWTRIPSNAQLSEAYAMGAWLPSGDELQFRPIHICWNRNPGEGTVGALRTNYARGFAVGTTSLRDDAWHHVAVVFVQGSEADTPLQVKLYVDGRFEGEGRPSPPGQKADSTKTPSDYSHAVRDTLWLGCRLGGDGPRTSRFRGTIDEFVLANRELAPAEIVQLMYQNSLAPVHLAADRIRSEEDRQPWEGL